MATYDNWYTEGGVPSNGQVAGVKVCTIDFSQQTGAQGDVFELFDLDTSEQVLMSGVEVVEASSVAATADVGLDGADEIRSAVQLNTVGAVPGGALAVGTSSGKVTVTIAGAATATNGRVKVWLVVANFQDPAEPVPVTDRQPPLMPTP